MERRDLQHDRHTVSLLTDHMVITPKYGGKILVGDVALVVEGLIRKTCKEMSIEVIDMAVNVDHVHLFIKYPPKYSVSFIAKKIKGRTSRILESSTSHISRNGAQIIYGLQGATMCRLVMDGKLLRNILGPENYVQKDENAIYKPCTQVQGIVTVWRGKLVWGWGSRTTFFKTKNLGITPLDNYECPMKLDIGKCKILSIIHNPINFILNDIFTKFKQFFGFFMLNSYPLMCKFIPSSIKSY